MIVALTGAKKNIGDFLIASRGVGLLRKYVDPDVLELDRFAPLENHLDLVNGAKAVFLCGGPAYAQDVYPSVYPLTRNLDDIIVPIVPFGLGWCGRPAGKPDKFSFSQQAVTALKRIHKSIEASSVRDNTTKKILNKHGFSNVVMTGCPVWYDLDKVGNQPSPPSQVNEIVFTTPDNPKMIFQVTRVLKLIRAKFPHAKIHCAFHRGIGVDKHTSLKASMGYKAMCVAAKTVGAIPVDVSYDLNRLDFYRHCELHIGYRVHAHLLFLSGHRASVLLCEDGRGQGMQQGLGLPSILCWNNGVIKSLNSTLDEEIEKKWPTLINAVDKINSSFDIMRSFLSTYSE